MGRIHRISDAGEILRRRQRLPAGTLVEVWPDLYVPGDVWVGDEAKQLLDSAGEPLAPRLSVDGAWVPVYYGPRLSDIDSLPRQETLQARVLSAHGVAVAWVPRDRFGEPTAYEPQSPADPTFFLRRPRGEAAHVWRLFRDKPEAAAYMREHDPRDPEARQWARDLPVETFEELIRRAAGG